MKTLANRVSNNTGPVYTFFYEKDEYSRTRVDFVCQLLRGSLSLVVQINPLLLDQLHTHLINFRSTVLSCLICTLLTK